MPWDRRRDYVEDYQIDESGRYVFTGTTYRWPVERKKFLRRQWLFSILVFGIQIAAGFIPGVGMNGRAWVLLPYAAALLAAGSVLWGTYELADGGDPLRDYNYKKSAAVLPFRGILVMIFSAAAVLGELINVLLIGQYDGTVSGALLYMAVEALGFLTGYLGRKQIAGLTWEELPKQGTNDTDP